MDEFAEYLRQQRERLQVPQVDPRVWSAIERELPPVRKSTSWRWLPRLVAACLLVVGISVVYLLRSPA
ncbi:MAG: hypothetical protein AAFZ52_13865, partial [Bacteroidota bacterium]